MADLLKKLFLTMFEKKLAKTRESLRLTVVPGIAIDRAWSTYATCLRERQIRTSDQLSGRQGGGHIRRPTRHTNLHARGGDEHGRPLDGRVRLPLAGLFPLSVFPLNVNLSWPQVREEDRE